MAISRIERALLFKTHENTTCLLFHHFVFQLNDTELKLHLQQQNFEQENALDEIIKKTEKYC